MFEKIKSLFRKKKPEVQVYEMQVTGNVTNAVDVTEQVRKATARRTGRVATGTSGSRKETTPTSYDGYLNTAPVLLTTGQPHEYNDEARASHNTHEHHGWVDSTPTGSTSDSSATSSSSSGSSSGSSDSGGSSGSSD